MKPIDADTLLKNVYKRCWDKDSIYLTQDDIEQLIKNAEPIELTIIRCKDCRYYRALGERSYCTKRLNVDSVTDRYRAPDFYCADAKLREVEG